MDFVVQFWCPSIGDDEKWLANMYVFADSAE